MFCLSHYRTSDPRFNIYQPDDRFRDSDGDGLADVVELVVGTDMANADSDGDGIPHGAEVDQGTNPLGGLPAVTGIIASADTSGTAVEVSAINEIALVADSDPGISVFTRLVSVPPSIPYWLPEASSWL